MNTIEPAWLKPRDWRETRWAPPIRGSCLPNETKVDVRLALLRAESHELITDETWAHKDIFMIELTEEMKTALDNALADNVPCILATASAEGFPGVGYRGSVMAYDDGNLAYWERVKRGGFKNVQSSPYVIVMYRNPVTRQAWKFFGKAKIYESGEIREAIKARTIKAELDRDLDETGFGIMVELERVETMSGEVLQSKDDQ